jgi:CheY-like chemotaxis protein
MALDELPIILVVEDEAVIQDLIEDALTNAGYHLMLSPSGEEALTLLQSGVVRYRALVTDINLDGRMSDWETARRVREIDLSFPVVYMTGAAADQWASQGHPIKRLRAVPV